MKLRLYTSFFLSLFLFSSFAFSQEGPFNPAPAPSVIEPPYSKFFKTTYLDLSAIYNDLGTAAIKDLLPPPLQGTLEAENDQNLREYIYADATKQQIYMAKDSEDSIFSYSYTLGEQFSSHYLPKTKALFNKVDDDVRLAIYIAKRFYGRRRPMRASGYCYPSGHSTRAFLWSTLLTEVFPHLQIELENQATVKAHNRVILGRHYPADTIAGRAFGVYLAQKLLNNPAFQKEWQTVKEEIKDCIENNTLFVISMDKLGNSVP